jgi:hypothetical protein
MNEPTGAAPLNPFAGMAIGLHNHTPDDVCDDTCSFYPAVSNEVIVSEDNE